MVSLATAVLGLFGKGTDETETETKKTAERQSEVKKTEATKINVDQMALGFFKKYDPNNQLLKSQKIAVTSYIAYLLSANPEKDGLVKRLNEIDKCNSLFASFCAAQATVNFSIPNFKANNHETNLELPSDIMVGFLRDLVYERPHILQKLMLHLKVDEAHAEGLNKILEDKANQRQIEKWFKESQDERKAFYAFLQTNFPDLFKSQDNVEKFLGILKDKKWYPVIISMASAAIYKKIERDLTPALNVATEGLKHLKGKETVDEDAFCTGITGLNLNIILMQRFIKESIGSKKAMLFYKETGFIDESQFEDPSKIEWHILFINLLGNEDWGPFFYNILFQRLGFDSKDLEVRQSKGTMKRAESKSLTTTTS